MCPPAADWLLHSTFSLSLFLLAQLQEQALRWKQTTLLPFSGEGKGSSHCEEQLLSLSSVFVVVVVVVLDSRYLPLSLSLSLSPNSHHFGRRIHHQKRGSVSPICLGSPLDTLEEISQKLCKQCKESSPPSLLISDSLVSSRVSPCVSPLTVVVSRSIELGAIDCWCTVLSDASYPNASTLPDIINDYHQSIDIAAAAAHRRFGCQLLTASVIQAGKCEVKGREKRLIT